MREQMNRGEAAARAAIGKARDKRDPAHIVTAMFAAFDRATGFQDGFMNELALSAAGLRSDPKAPGSYVPAPALEGAQ